MKKAISIILFVLFGFSYFATAEEFKDCSKLKEKCFDVNGTPEKPFFMRAPKHRGVASAVKNKKVAVLVHGLTDSPYTFKDLSLFLNKQGYAVYAVLLPGHGADLKDLSKVKNTEWLKETWETLKKALAETKAEKALLVGDSLGGLLVTDIAEQPLWRDKISGLVLQVPNFQIQDQIGQVVCDAGVGEYIDKANHSVCESVTLADHVREHIRNVHAPVHVTLTDYDLNLDNKKVLDAVQNMQSSAKEVFYLRKSYEDIERPGIHFTQVVVPLTLHDEVNYDHDRLRGRKNPAFDQMVENIKAFLERNKI